MLNTVDNKNFIYDIAIPFYTSLYGAKCNFIIYNNTGQIITASDSAVNMLGYSKVTQLNNKTIHQIYKYSKSYPNFCNDLNKKRLNVIQKKSTCNYLCIAEFSTGIAAFTVEHIPIFAKNKTVEASIELFNEIPSFTSKTNNILSKRQAEIVFFLIIGASQKEIASIFNISRGSISKTIENICIRLNIPGASEQNIIDVAAKIGCARLPIDVIRPGILLISKLHDNRHILNLFR